MAGNHNQSNRSPRVAWVDQFRVYRFPLAVGVVITHIGIWMLNHQDLFPISPEQNPVAWWIIRFLSYGVFRVSTAAFLFIAGFLFFRQGGLNFGEYGRRLRSRIKTLVVPYIVWNLLFLAALAVQGYLAAVEARGEMDLAFVIKGLIGWPTYPVNTPLWFIRDLLVLLVLSPILTPLLNRFAVPVLLLLFLHWVHPMFELVPGGIPRTISVFFFCLGATVGLKGVRCESLPAPRFIFWASLSVVIACSAVRSSLELAGLFPWCLDSLTAATRMAGVLLIVSGAVAVIPRKFGVRTLTKLSDSSFFVYASHQLLLSVLCKLLLPMSVKFIHLSPLMAFLILLLLTVSLSTITWLALKRFAPALLVVLDGGRSFRSIAARGSVT